MRGLLLLSDPRHSQMHPERWIRAAENLDMEIQYEKTAVMHQPLFFSSHLYELLPRLQLKIYRLQRRCDWICIMAEGDMAAYAVILAAQLPVDRLILFNGVFARRTDRRQRRINAFARRNLALVTAEIVAVGMERDELRRMKSITGYQSGGVTAVMDAAELWQKRETFLTAHRSAHRTR